MWNGYKGITNLIAGIDPLNSEKCKDAMISSTKHIDKALTYRLDYKHGFM